VYYDGHRFRDWCTHVVRLRWRWSREDLAVADPDTGRTDTSPRWWYSNDDTETDRRPFDGKQLVSADGGVNVSPLPAFRLERSELRY